MRGARLMHRTAWVHERVGHTALAFRWGRRGLRALEGLSGRAAARERAGLIDDARRCAPPAGPGRRGRAALPRGDRRGPGRRGRAAPGPRVLQPRLGARRPRARSRGDALRARARDLHARRERRTTGGGAQQPRHRSPTGRVAGRRRSSCSRAPPRPASARGTSGRPPTATATSARYSPTRGAWTRPRSACAERGGSGTAPRMSTAWRSPRRCSAAWPRAPGATRRRPSCSRVPRAASASCRRAGDAALAEAYLAEAALLAGQAEDALAQADRQLADGGGPRALLLRVRGVRAAPAGRPRGGRGAALEDALAASPRRTTSATRSP